ncbi:MAG: hypothetical protein HWD61_07055 [Parachlamydiaceae bacterium]|nr:MAG: hypothetical protein HWD61_07055 [Parachlamydiaceae bacterium]
MGEDSTSIIEFIPKGESQDNWSEIITIHKLIGKKINAAMMIDTLKSSILSQTKNGKIWKGSLTRKDAYLFGSLGLSYDLNGRHEILGCRYYSGPYDCVGIQYTLRPVKGFHDEDMEKNRKLFQHPYRNYHHVSQ